MVRGLGDRALGSSFLWIQQRRGAGTLVGGRGKWYSVGRDQSWVRRDGFLAWEGHSGLAQSYGLYYTSRDRVGRIFQGETG